MSAAPPLGNLIVDIFPTVHLGSDQGGVVAVASHLEGTADARLEAAGTGGIEVVDREHARSLRYINYIITLTMPSCLR